MILPDIAKLTVPGGALDPDLFWQTFDKVGERMRLGLPEGALPAALTIGNANPDREALLGAPLLDDLLGELELSSSEFARGGAMLMIANEGSGLLAWRVTGMPSWLDVGLQAGVALGAPATDFPNVPLHSTYSNLGGCGRRAGGLAPGAESCWSFTTRTAAPSRGWSPYHWTSGGLRTTRRGARKAAPPVAQPDRATDF